MAGSMRHHEFAGVPGGVGLAGGIGEGREFLNHLRQVPAGEFLDLRSVHGDVVVEYGVRPSYRVYLSHRATGVGL
jgi:pSer/pThr/pTyr-binding forkhead associated (FHA) protein